MTVEYLVLGVLLVVMSAGQIYFRHFAGGPGEGGAQQRGDVPTRSGKPAGRAWRGWTAILGFLGAAMGVALIVLGVLGR